MRVDLYYLKFKTPLPDSPRTVRRCFSLVSVSFLGSATFCAAFLMSPSLLDFLNIAKAADIWPSASELGFFFHISSALSKIASNSMANCLPEHARAGEATTKKQVVDLQNY